MNRADRRAATKRKLSRSIGPSQQIKDETAELLWFAKLLDDGVMVHLDAEKLRAVNYLYETVKMIPSDKEVCMLPPDKFIPSHWLILKKDFSHEWRAA